MKCKKGGGIQGHGEGELGMDICSGRGMGGQQGGDGQTIMMRV